MPSIATAIASDRLVELQSTRSEQVLEELVAAVCRSQEDAADLAQREEPLLQKIREREELASTGIDGGLALPHARLPGLRAFVGALARSRAGIDFGSQDGRPVHLFLLMVGPEGLDRQPDYLRLLRSATQFLRAERDRLLELDDLKLAYAICQEY